VAVAKIGDPLAGRTAPRLGMVFMGPPAGAVRRHTLPTRLIRAKPAKDLAGKINLFSLLDAEAIPRCSPNHRRSNANLSASMPVYLRSGGLTESTAVNTQQKVAS
jgi:hypothetical protein